MDLKLKGRIALVTGASQGLGYATALCFAEEGCKVAINSRKKEKLNDAAENITRATGAEVFPIAGDVSDPAAGDEIIRQVMDHFGRLDILVTNAGGPPAGSFDTVSESDWYKAFELSFMSQVRLIRAALPCLKKSDAASVVTINSIAVKQPIPNLILSNSIRAATVGLTKSLALEFATQGIRFNAMLPGWTETERVTRLMQARAEQNHTNAEEEMQKMVNEFPMQRMATPEEFARAAVFLSSPTVKYITGILLPVDGGTLKGTF